MSTYRDNGFARAQMQYENKLPPEAKVMGTCENCGSELYDNSPYWEDGYGNLFCDETCAEEHYGIHKRSWN